MKNLFLLIFLNCILSGVYAQVITLDETRRLYARSTQDKETCEKLYARLSKDEIKDNILLTGYYGAVTANMANHQKEPAQKLKLFNRGRKTLEEAIATDSMNAELRFLRYTIQSNCPKSLHYDKNLEYDKTFIIQNLGDAKIKSIQRKMAAFLLAAKNLTEEEKEKIKKIINQE